MRLNIGKKIEAYNALAEESPDEAIGSMEQAALLDAARREHSIRQFFYEILWKIPWKKINKTEVAYRSTKQVELIRDIESGAEVSEKQWERAYSSKWGRYVHCVAATAILAGIVARSLVSVREG